MATLDGCIVEACKKCWETEFVAGMKNKNNCSGFVKAVAKALGVPLSETANADGLVDELVRSSKWTRLSSGKDAAEKAALGNLVVAGLKSSDHAPPRSNGHVVVIVAGTLYRSTYPVCWGGSIGGAQSAGTKSVGEVWNRADRDQVAYFAYNVAVACSVNSPAGRR